MDRGKSPEKGAIRNQQCSPGIGTASWLSSQGTGAKGKFGGEGTQANL